MAKTGALTPKQRQAIASLLSERDVRGAAKAAGIAERTLHRWLSDAGFRAALVDQEGEIIDQATRRLLDLTEHAIDTLDDILQTGNENQRLRASQAVLDHLLKLRELRNVESRLADLEAAVYGKRD